MTNQPAAATSTENDVLTRAGRLAGIGLALGGTAAFLVFSRFLYAGLSGQRQIGTLLVIVLFYLLPAVVAALLFASLRLKPVQKLRVFTFCAAIAVAVYAVELVLVFLDVGQIKPAMSRMATVRDKKQYAAELTREFGGSIDIRTAEEVLADLRSRKVEAVPIVTASNHLFVHQPDGGIESAIKVDGHEVMPLGSVSNSVTLLCNESGQWIDYRSDSRGFNNPDGQWRLKPLDMALLGDSFIQGYCVPQDRAIAALIRERVAATLNLGMAGDGPLLTLATLTEYLPRLSPKIVLWFYYEGNDLLELQLERRNRLLENYLTPDYAQEYLPRQPDIDRAIVAEMPRLAATDKENLKRRSWNAAVFAMFSFAKLTSVRDRLGLIREMDRRSLEEAVDFEKGNLDVFREIMSQAQARVAAWNGQLYFVYLPEWSRYSNYRSLGEAKRDDVMKLVGSLGIPIIDVDPVFRAHGDPLSLFPFRGLGHYTEAGHRLVAEEVLRRLAADGRVDAEENVGSRVGRAP